MLVSGMAAGQRRRFATLLNTLIGAGMCRAPACKPQILPSVAMKYTLPDATCDEFMLDESKVPLCSSFLSHESWVVFIFSIFLHQDAFVEAIETAFTINPITIRYLVSIEVTGLVMSCVGLG